jgi:uncharacterized protein (TIRG00374 family)
MNKRNLFGLLFSLGVIAYVLIKLDRQAVYETFTQIEWGWLVAAFGIFLVNYVLRTLRFRLLLDLKSYPFYALFGVTNLYGMYVYLLPAKFGELTYPLLLKRNMQVPLTESTATLIAARTFDFATIVLLLPVVLIFFWAKIPPWARIGSLVFAGAVLLFGIGLLWFIRSPAGIKKIQQVTIFKHSWAIRLQDGLLKLIVSLQAIDRQQRYSTLFLVTIAIWLCVQINLYFIVRGLGEPLNFLQIVTITIIMVPMTLLPLQGFADLGTHEIGWTVAFALFGFPEATALAIAVSSHIVLLLFVLLLGLLGTVLLRVMFHLEDSEQY